MLVRDGNILTFHLNSETILGDNKAALSPHCPGIPEAFCGNAAFGIQFCKVQMGRYACFLKGFSLRRNKRGIIFVLSTTCNKLPAFSHIASLENAVQNTVIVLFVRDYQHLILCSCHTVTSVKFKLAAFGLSQKYPDNKPCPFIRKRSPCGSRVGLRGAAPAAGRLRRDRCAGWTCGWP